MYKYDLCSVIKIELYNFSFSFLNVYLANFRNNQQQFYEKLKIELDPKLK